MTKEQIEESLAAMKRMELKNDHIIRVLNTIMKENDIKGRVLIKDGEVIIEYAST